MQREPILAELRRNILAALFLFAVIGVGAAVFVGISQWH
jgi:hypothetical protein